MQNAILKITALAGVVGLGFLVVLQAQRGLSDTHSESIAEQALDDLANDDVSLGSAGFAPFADDPFASQDAEEIDTNQIDNENPAEGQTEPSLFQFASQSDSRAELETAAYDDDVALEEISGELLAQTSGQDSVRSEEPGRLNFRDVIPSRSQTPQPSGLDFRAVVPQRNSGGNADADEFQRGTLNINSNSSSGEGTPTTNIDPFDPFASELSGDARPTTEPAPVSDTATSGSAFLKELDGSSPTNNSEGSTGPGFNPVIRSAESSDPFASDVPAGASSSTHESDRSSAGPSLLMVPNVEGESVFEPSKVEGQAVEDSFEPGPTTPTVEENPFAHTVPTADDATGPALFGADSSQQVPRGDVNSDASTSAQAGSGTKPSFGDYRIDSRSMPTDSSSEPEQAPTLIERPVVRSLAPEFRLPQEEQVTASSNGDSSVPPLDLSESSTSTVASDSSAPSNESTTGAPFLAPQLSGADSETTTATSESVLIAPRSSAEATSPKELTPPPEATQLNIVGSELSTVADEQDAFAGAGTVRRDVPQGQLRPQLTIEKLAPPRASLGQAMVYSIVIRNIGQTDATKVVVEDQIPKGTRLTGTIPRAELIDKKLIWRLGTVAPGREERLSVRVIPTAEGTIGSVATVNFVAEVAAKTTVIAPKLHLEMTAPKQAKIGENVVFDFKLSNNGNAEASGVFLRDVIPAGFQHPDGNDLEYEVGKLPPGESQEIRLTLVAVSAGEISNRAVVTADGGVKTEVSAPIVVAGSRFSITRTGPGKQLSGRATEYTNTVTNESNTPIVAANIIEQVPDGMEFVEATLEGQYDPQSRTITWRIDKLGPGQSATVNSKLIPKLSGSYENIVRVQDRYGAESQVSTQTEVVGFPSLTVDVPETTGAVVAGEFAKVTLRVKNRGSAAATNVAVTVIVPPQLELTEVVSPIQYNKGTNGVQFEAIPSLDAQTESVIELKLHAKSAGDTRLQIQIDSDQMQRPLVQEQAVVVFTNE